MPTHASRRDVTRLRLVRQGLVGAKLRGPLDVAERLLALQAQDLPAATWAIGVRAPGTTQADVGAAIDSGTIVRSWPMRGTLHLVPAAELKWMLQLTAPRILAGLRTRRAQLDLDQADIERARAVTENALAGGRELSRAGFLATLDHNGIATAGQRGYHLIAHLALSGTLCWGPRLGSQQALVLFDEWVPSSRRLERDEALGEFVVRYFSGHGPATLKDFIGWSQLTVADARTGLLVARDRLTELVVDGTSYFLPASADEGEPGLPPQQRSPLLALPGFDEYLIGYRDRSFAIDDGDLLRVVPGKNGIFLPIMVSSGRIIGTWRRRASMGALSVEPVPFSGLTARQLAGFASAIRGYSRFLGLPTTVLPPAELGPTAGNDSLEA